MLTLNRKPLTIAMFTLTTCLVVLIAVAPLRSQQKSKEEEKDAPKSKEATPPLGAVEVRLVDDSVVKLILRDERIELETAYGKLLIPVADIQRIEFGQRIDDDVRKKISTAIASLGSADFRIRQSASRDLLVFKEKAYLALVDAAKGKDQEKVRRIEELLEKIREAVPADVLEIPMHDIIHTADSKISGKIKSDVLRVGTLAFGEQKVRLADIRSLRSQSWRDQVEPAATGAVLDAGALRVMQHEVGKTLVFRVTGPPVGIGNQMGVYGTDVYTMDSSLEAAAVHAGVVQPGKTANIRVTILGQQAGFQPSMRNGIASHGYGPYPAFRIEQPKGPARKD